MKPMNLKMVPVVVGGSGGNRIELSVSSDYVMDIVGTRLSLFPWEAQNLADVLQCVLPSPRLVDLIWEKADLKLEPKSLSTNRGSQATLIQHNNLINQQINSREFTLVAGHKKDIVLSSRIPAGKVVIYGWHKLDGKPIQPESSIHSASYKDYSQGTRLISRKVVVDGVGMDIWDAVNTPTWKQLVESRTLVRAYPSRKP